MANENPTIVEVVEEVTRLTATTEDVIIELNPEIVEIEVNNFVLPVSSFDATNVVVSPYSSITATNVQGALQQLADQNFRSSVAPTTNVEEGDTWYNTYTEQFYVYRQTSDGLAWVPIMIGNDSLDSDTLDAGAF